MTANLDRRVHQKDVAGVQANRSRPSVFDFDGDGVTDGRDLKVVRANQGRSCSNDGP